LEKSANCRGRSAEFQQLLNAHPGFIQSLAEGSGTQVLMVRNDDARIRIVTPEDDGFLIWRLTANPAGSSTLIISWQETSVGSFTGGHWL
jgi:hypothetical protein